MSKFRKKPVIVEAEQFFPEKKPWPEGVFVRDITPSDDNYPPHSIGMWTIQTLEGQYDVQPGDWIITGIKGEFYPIKNSIFKETYEPVI